MLVPELYRNISIHGSNSFQKLKCFIQFLIDNKDVAVNIRRLYLHLDPSNMETKDFTEADLEWSHWAARQSGAPSPYYLWHSEDGQLLQMSESRCSRTRILHLGILLEIILSRVHGVQELGLAVPGGLFCDQYGPWSRTELDGLLWTGEPGPSDPLKIQTFRGVQRPLPNIKMLAKIRGMIQGCSSLVSFKYLNSRADAYVPHWPVSPEEVVTILREHQNTTTTLLTLCLDLNDWYRGEYEAIRSLSDFSNLENLWVDASSNDLGDNGDDWTFSIMNDGDGYGGGSYLQDGDAKEEDIGETNKDTTLSYQERFIRAGIESPSTLCTLGELW
ncbi:uncharacterized protein CLUP02_09625 [Colletotrichum lupini]|uniref:Uncharacterized protein n=1 Tax=Colletotrichum lupini TaxID=145971 RepID=A0A9Q8WI09_9PEZI|nr:uncharacterized protein CLUP02_09625 [Colletotrichum lupini]UQC84129.1 hypothetical protein CLUP02_09625 [Colletotrichum lupini]